MLTPALNLHLAVKEIEREYGRRALPTTNARRFPFEVRYLDGRGLHMWSRHKTLEAAERVWREPLGKEAFAARTMIVDIARGVVLRSENG